MPDTAASDSAGKRVRSSAEMDANLKSGYEGRYPLNLRPVEPMEMGSRTVVVLRDPADTGPPSWAATATRALVRGQVPGDAGERPVLDVRNEPGWIVHLRPGGASEHLQLHIVAFTADGPPAVLPAASERTDDAFRVLGEVGALGLRPGNVTLYFVVGPHGAANEALALAEALQAGATLARGWAAKRLDIRVVDGS